MPRIINTRQVVHPRLIHQTKGRGIDGCRLSMCDASLDPSMENDGDKEEKVSEASKDEHMKEMISKLSKIRIINPKNGAKAKKEIKNKYITI